jgi:hypothetical protein
MSTGSVYQYIGISVYLYICISVYLYVCMSSHKDSRVFPHPVDVGDVHAPEQLEQQRLQLVLVDVRRGYEEARDTRTFTPNRRI